MKETRIYNLNAVELVAEVTKELEYRRRSLEEIADLSRRLERYRDTVVEFVKCINSSFFEFMDLLNQRLLELKLGSAELSIRSEQPHLQPHPLDDWTIRRFPLVRADLTVRLSYLVDGKEVHAQTLAAIISFLPHGGAMEWKDGDCDHFRSHRENAADDVKFGEPELLDLLASIGLRRRGREDVGLGRFRDEPEAIVLRRICQDGNWPGWNAP